VLFAFPVLGLVSLY